MTEENPLWVCSKCHVLQGIEVWFVNGEAHGRCVNCGVPTDPAEVSFLNVEKAYEVIQEVQNVVPEYLHDYTRYSWVSRRTVGVIFELGIHELMQEVDYDPRTFFEDEIGVKLGLTMTVFFEN